MSTAKSHTILDVKNLHVGLEGVRIVFDDGSSWTLTVPGWPKKKKLQRSES